METSLVTDQLHYMIPDGADLKGTLALSCCAFLGRMVGIQDGEAEKGVCSTD